MVRQPRRMTLRKQRPSNVSLVSEHRKFNSKYKEYDWTFIGRGWRYRAIAVQTLQEGKAHPIEAQVADPDCDLDYVTEGARDITADYTISNSFGLITIMV